jgi:lipoprotein-anchoring transpeptidase ErfK/SrfK
MDDEAAERKRSTWPEALVIVVLVCAGLAFALDRFTADDEPASVDEVDLAAVDMKALKPSNTETRVKAAQRDTDQQQATTGLVVHPQRKVPVFDEPGGTAIAKLAPQQFGDTWVPVIDRADGWYRVMLPSRPNGSTGWLRDEKLAEARSHHLIRVHTGSRTVELFDAGDLVGSWPVAVGAPDTPTPTGRTFVLGQFTDPGQSFSPVIIPLGTHSATLDTYGGGPGTVAFHGWNDPSVFGDAVSHGCIRVPGDALDQLRTVPLGTTVLIDEA